MASLFAPHFINHLKMSFVSLHHCKKTVLVLIGFSFSVSRFLLTLFSFIASPLFRFHGISLKNDFKNGEAIPNENIKDDYTLAENNDVGDSLNGVEEKFESSFTFKFPAFDEFIKSKKEKSELFGSDFLYSSDGRYEFTPRPSFRVYIEEPRVLNVDVKDINGDSVDSLFVEHQDNEDDKEADGILPNEVLCNGEKTENSEPAVKKHKFLSNQEFSNVLEDVGNSSGNYTIESHWDGFLSDGDFVEEKEFDKEKSSKIVDGKSSISFGTDFLCEEHFQESVDNAEIEDCVDNVKKDDNKRGNGLCDPEKPNAKESHNFGDANKLESLWEHQELIEQLKMELKKVRATGLPTILEESESPKITEDLKPWKIDETFQHEECLDELHKFYKSYTERMRKLDIFNYQKMYAIGFLRLKDPFQSIPRQKTSSHMFKSIISENFRQLKHKVKENDPMEKFLKEIESDLEVVYVGQMCLSWELLHWQYKKALELWDSDPCGIHGYNEVAGEFQQFQVLIQRFIEDETFQGPRVQYYIKSRCVNRNLLQVPLIREDSYGNSRNTKKIKRSEYVITNGQLVEIIEESIRTLWRFIRADKDTCSLISKGYRGLPLQLQNPVDLELLKEIRNVLQKKEKLLKELRGGKCILRRFRACREEENSDKVLYNFFSQVDMKLVCRVLNISKITSDQLVWCHTKLNSINFEPRGRGGIPVDCSFLPFPC